MRQQTLADSGFEKFRKKTRKELFLEDMEQIIPWPELCGAIEPYCPEPEGAGRRPVGIERMLRIHFLQHWFASSDPGAEARGSLKCRQVTIAASIAPILTSKR